MLQLKNITKNYVVSSELTVRALKGLSLNFRANEFVSILGPSGCGKTTLLNIVGGLDRYTDGDLLINGKSTKGFRHNDWDAYRNRSVGFVFQSYNLIPHMNVLDNVTLSLSLAGVSRAERIDKAKAALAKVGLADQLKKRPNQLSGGQMQRVAIARAIVNDPDIILADEPTGALDTETGVQVMELLKEIANDRLVIMVTHNQELAADYSTRIVRLLDGELISDTNPYSDEQLKLDSSAASDGKQPQAATAASETADGQELPTEPPKRKKGWRTMSLFTAFSISAKNLWSKKGRMLLTSFAGSIGIFGITLVLAISAGMDNFVAAMQEEAIGDSAITISETTYDVNKVYDLLESVTGGKPYPKDTTGIIPNSKNVLDNMVVSNNITDQYIDYVNNVDFNLINAINYAYSVKMNVLQDNGKGAYVRRTSWGSYARQMVANDELVENNYDVMYKLGDDGSETDYKGNGYPRDYTEVAIVVDRYNRLSTSALENLGLMERQADELPDVVPYESIVGREYKLILNDGWYTLNNKGLYAEPTTAAQYKALAQGEHALTLRIVSVLRPKNDKVTTWLSSGLAYLPSLTDFVLNNALQSNVGKAQLANKDKDVIKGTEFPELSNYGTTTREQLWIKALKAVGAYSTPTSISIYPKNANAKIKIFAYLDQWNQDNADNVVVYTDYTQVAVNALNTIIDVISYVLIAFSAVSLVVSTVMISVITYTSVIERVKEIGVLRSIGARKRDIYGIFNAETAMIGTFAGLIGIVVALIAGVVVNNILYKAFSVSNIVLFSPQIILVMLALSIGLTLFAGLIPSTIAARKDPVVCLRSQ